MGFLQKLVKVAPLIVSPVVLAIFSLVSAYVLRFRLAKGGLGFDYAIFCIVALLGLFLGGAL